MLPHHGGAFIETEQRERLAAAERRRHRACAVRAHRLEGDPADAGRLATIARLRRLDARGDAIGQEA
jgi:hypothetical protein